MADAPMPTTQLSLSDPNTQVGQQAPPPVQQQQDQPGVQRTQQVDPTNELLTKLMGRLGQGQRSSIPVPQPKPQKTMSGSGFIPFLTSIISGAADKHKKQQELKAVGTIQTLHNAWENAQDITNGDQQKAMQAFGQMPEVQRIMTDPKELKQLSKLLQFDALNPEKNKTVYHDALGRVVQASKAKGLIDALKGAITRHQEKTQQSEQLTPEQGQQNTEKFMGRMAQPEGMDPKAITETLKSKSELQNSQANLERSRAQIIKAQADARSKYDFKPDKDGNIVALDKTSGQGHLVTDVNGKPLTSAAKLGAAPKVASVDGVPMGVSRDGKMLTPDSPDWTPKDQEVFNAATHARAQGEADKQKLANVRQTFFSSLPYNGIAKVDIPELGIKQGEVAPVTRGFASAHPDKIAPAAEGDKVMQATARYGEIQRTFDGLNQAISDLPDSSFDADARAAMTYVLRAPHPESAVDVFLKGEVAKKLTPAQGEYVQWLASAAESIQAMTTLQGMGARSSDRLRASLVAMLPSGSTPSKSWAQGQMKKVQVEKDALFKGLPSLGALSSKVAGDNANDNLSKARSAIASLSPKQKREVIQGSTSLSADEKKALLKEIK